MRIRLLVGWGICALVLTACGNVDLADANLSTSPLWTINNGTASLAMPAQLTSQDEAVLRIDNQNFSEHQQGAVDSVLHYSDNERTERFLRPER